MAFYTRREILRGAAAWALAQGSLGRVLAAGEAAPEFRFIVASDLHYRDARCGDWLERVVTHIRSLRPRPAFCVLNGDLSESGTRPQLGAVREIFHPLAMPIHAVIGNHDYTKEESRSEYLAQFGKGLNNRFDHGQWQFLVLDSTEGSRVYRTDISRDTFDWLDRTLLGIDRKRPLVVLTHFPLGRNWLRPMNAGTLLARFEGYDLRAVLSGHWHGITKRVQGVATLSTGRCCSWWRGNHDGSHQKGYLLCEVRNGQIGHHFIPVDLP